MKILFLLLAVCSLEAAENPFLTRLIEGNHRYVKDQLLHSDRGQERRASLVSKQAPFAVILSCSDSRVSPEIIFDQGLGDLFVIRVAGNVAGPLAVESVAYAVEELHSSIALVLGHENCGAVQAVVKHQAQEMSQIAALIEPAVVGLKEDELEKAVKANVRRVVKTLKNSPAFANKAAIFGGYYHLESGRVEILNDEPAKSSS